MNKNEHQSIIHLARGTIGYLTSDIGYENSQNRHQYLEFDAWNR